MDDHSQTTPLIPYTVRGTPRRARLECVLTTQPVMCRTNSTDAARTGSRGRLRTQRPLRHPDWRPERPEARRARGRLEVLRSQWCPVGRRTSHLFCETNPHRATSSGSGSLLPSRLLARAGNIGPVAPQGPRPESRRRKNTTKDERGDIERRCPTAHRAAAPGGRGDIEARRMCGSARTRHTIDQTGPKGQTREASARTHAVHIQARVCVRREPVGRFASSVTVTVQRRRHVANLLLERACGVARCTYRAMPSPLRGTGIMKSEITP